jgi:hypothetical protein
MLLQLQEVMLPLQLLAGDEFQCVQFIGGLVTATVVIFLLVTDCALD